MRRKQGTSADGRSAPAPARGGGPPLPGAHDGELVDLDEALDLSAGAAKCWQVVEVLAQDPVPILPAFGTTIDLAPGSVIRGDSALACLGVNGWIAWRRVLVSEAAHASDTLRRFPQPFGDGAGCGGPDTPRDTPAGGQPSGGVGLKADLEELGGGGEGGGTGGSPADSPAGKGKHPSGEDDVRTLSVEWDEHGERFKPWRTACREMSRHEFSDWGELFEQAPASVLALFKNFERFGGIPFAGGTTG